MGAPELVDEIVVSSNLAKAIVMHTPLTNADRRMWFVRGSIAMVCLVAYPAIFYLWPATAANASGTIGAVKKYRTEQMGPGSSGSGGTTIAALLQNKGFVMLVNTPSFQRQLKNEMLWSVLASDGLREGVGVG